LGTANSNQQRGPRWVGRAGVTVVPPSRQERCCHMMAPSRVWLIGLVLCLSATLTWAQLYSGSVVGVVSDPSGAVIPGAKVSLVDDEKGFTFNAVTDASGRYVFRGVPRANTTFLSAPTASRGRRAGASTWM
jgi:hypothetical protein